MNACDRFHPDRNFKFDGGIGRLVKCFGYRVESAEIKSVLRKVPVAESCAVVEIDDPSSGQRPAAALVLQPGKHLCDLIPAIKSSLPVDLQAVKVLLLNQLSQLSTGKTDYNAIARDWGYR